MAALTSKELLARPKGQQSRRKIKDMWAPFRSGSPSSTSKVRLKSLGLGLALALFVQGYMVSGTGIVLVYSLSATRCAA
jgi:hypothetical protein